MTKIPVGATIAHAYRFAFGGIVDLVRVSWLPLAGVSIISFMVLIPALSNLMNMLAGQAAGSAGREALILIPAYLAVILLFFVQICAVAQLALGVPKSGWLIFPFGRPLWRLIGAFVLVFLMFIGISLLMGLVAGFVAVMAGGAAVAAGLSTGMVLVALVVRLLLYGLMIFLFLRLGFLLTPAAVEGPDLGLKRSWRLSRGNFWRLFAVAFVIMLPVIVLEIAVTFALMPHLPMPAPDTDPNQYRAAVLAWEAGLLAGLRDYRMIVAPLWCLFAMLLYGLMVGAQCFAYRAVTAPASDEGPWSSASPR